ncbi:class I SAM-dependent methyltransferase [Salegentibacter sp. HM20]
MKCSLCQGETRQFWKDENREFVECLHCGGIQLLPRYYVDETAEKKRYLTHNNDVEDPRYQKFVSPITSAILQDFQPENSGLDYGCGTGPVATSELRKQGFEKIALFDPYFYYQPEVLEHTYDFIICCEVMEHFYDPEAEFKALSNRLKPGGKLYCKTSLYFETINFENWYYKDDPTHVFLYTTKSLEWIAENLDFSTLEIDPEVIIFKK